MTLGDLSAERFLADYWQQRPLLIRGAFPDDYVPLTGNDLAGLACEDPVESRLVRGPSSDGSWRLDHGPFAESVFTNLPERNWTLLVQAVDLWVPEMAELLNQFEYLPRWRLDDVMASFAAPGGSVGPHFDQYDVFLIQSSGRRRWRIGRSCDADTALVENSELKLLRDFATADEWLLEPGDMLYLPPGLAHWGVAETACVTLSVGFRSPSVADMLGDLAIELTARDGQTYYRDPPLDPSMANETINPKFIAGARELLQSLLDDEELLADWFARYMTQPKYPELIELTGEQRLARVGQKRYRNGELESD